MWTHRFAVATVCATFVLLLIGGIVHGTGSSLACPDWPTCFGSFFPPMTGNVLVEHGHRLAAATVGLLTVILAVILCFRAWGGHGDVAGTGPAAGAGEPGAVTPVKTLAYLGLFAVALVCFQGVLGGLTVLYKLPALVSAAHLATSMLFFSLLVALACLTRPVPSQVPVPAGTHRLLLFTTLLAYAQIALGGLVRHTGAGLACLDLPLCHGRLLPLGAHPTVLIQALHRLNAVLVGTLVVVVAVRVLRALPMRGASRGANRSAASAPGLAGARLLALGLPVLILVQITLGVMSVLSFLGLFYVTAHLGVAALLLGALVALTFLLRHEPGPAPAPDQPNSRERGAR